MQLKPNGILSSLNKESTPPLCALVYGQDTGLIEQCANTYASFFSKKFDCEVIKLSYDQISSDPSAFHNHINIVSMFSSFKFIIVNGCRESFDSKVQNIIENINSKDVFILFKAEDIRKTSTIVKFFSKQKACFITPCYKQSIGELVAFASRTFKENGYNFHVDAPALIVNSLPNDQKLIEIELEKLMLYKMEEKFINIADVTTLLSNTSELSLDNLCLAIGTRNYKMVELEIKRVTRDDVNLVLILRTLLNYFTRILYIKQKTESGESLNNVINGIKPPIFFKQKENILKVASNSSVESATNIIERLLQLEVKVKLNAGIGVALLSQHLCSN